MKPTPTLLATARAHTPLIHFLGRRQWPSSHTPAPHPGAPAELKASFQEFVKKMRAEASPTPTGSQSKSGGSRVYSEFWEAPGRLKLNDLADWEVEAVMSGGASSFK